MSAKPWVPERIRSIAQLRDRASGCRGCELYRAATQTVFGAGSSSAEIVLIGEQPGDSEDRQGKPFVGPAGTMLQRGLEEAGIGREEIYVTNAVRHFRNKPLGKRRLHQKPGREHISACRPWLEAELGLLKPALVITLGATAALALFRKEMRIEANRGSFHPLEFGGHSFEALLTYHPSAILRQTDSESRERMYRNLVQDLSRAKRLLARGKAA